MHTVFVINLRNWVLQVSIRPSDYVLLCIHRNWSGSRMKACRSSSGTQWEPPSSFSSLHCCWPLPTVSATQTLACMHVYTYACTHAHTQPRAVFLCRSVEDESDRGYWLQTDKPGGEDRRGQFCLVTQKMMTVVPPTADFKWTSDCPPASQLLLVFMIHVAPMCNYTNTKSCLYYVPLQLSR